LFAAKIRKRRVVGMRSSNWRWHLDEVFLKINGQRDYPWRPVDHEGEAPESFVTKTCVKKAALKFLKKSKNLRAQPSSARRTLICTFSPRIP
jgi:putative transposase